MSASTTISLVGHVSRDCLLQEFWRLSYTQTNLIKYIATMNDIRNDAARRYIAIKHVCFLERYRLLRSMIPDILTAYQEIVITKESELRILNRGEFDLLNVGQNNGLTGGEDNTSQPDSISILDQQQLTKIDDYAKVKPPATAMSDWQLKKTVRELQLSVANLQQIFKEECAIFQQLAIQYKHCAKYSFLQRYIALKYIIKTAGSF